jgi:hypothetical protein
MGFDIRFSTTEKISLALQREIIEDADDLYSQKSWVQCDGPLLEDAHGYLSGSSRLTPDPDPDDLADARCDGYPDGTVLDLLKGLCQLSGRHDIEWQISHDHSDGVVGSIECGRPDEAVQRTFEGLAAMCEDMAEDLPPDDLDLWDE